MKPVTRMSMIAALAVAFAGCGGGGASEKAPVAYGQKLSVQEDSRLEGALKATVRSPQALDFAIVSGPAHGTVQLNASTGRFVYEPSADYFGPDGFTFNASAAGLVSKPANVEVLVSNVDDPPRVEEIPDVGNSAAVGTVRVALRIVEPDGEPVTVDATAANPSVVGVSVDLQQQTVLLEAREYGESAISVLVRDAGNAVTRQFRYSVADVTKTARVASQAPDREAIVVLNERADATDFELGHNGQVAFARMDQIIDTVRALPDDIEDESFARKLWRFVRDNVYHAPPVSAEQWLYASWPTMASFGWGFCGHVAAVFVRIARAAGYEARVWGLNGHVVPEVYAEGAWQMYDPDLAVYYHRRDGAVASVEDLVGDPFLIRNPVDPIFHPGGNDWAYSETVAEIYASTDDNRIADHVFLSQEGFRGSRVTLPAGARLIYPGRWTPPPIGYDAEVEYTIEAFRQARMELPSGYAGSLSTPWVLWDVQGIGRVDVMGRQFAAGSKELKEFLQTPGASVTSVTVLENPSGLALVFMVNALWYQVDDDNEIGLTGKDVWALRVHATSLAEEHRLDGASPEILMKPRP